jgi:hypothetical protein
MTGLPKHFYIRAAFASIGFLLAAWLYLGYVEAVVRSNNRTLLIHAVRMGDAQEVRALLRGGVDPRFTFNGSETPLSAARDAGHGDIASLLLSYKGK